MKQLTTTRATLLVVKVNDKNHLSAESSIELSNNYNEKDWENLGLSNEISEEVWREIVVEYVKDEFYPDYTKINDIDMCFSTATESARSLFGANGLFLEPELRPVRKDYPNMDIDAFEDTEMEWLQRQQNTGPFMVLKLKSDGE